MIIIPTTRVKSSLHTSHTLRLESLFFLDKFSSVTVSLLNREPVPVLWPHAGMVYMFTWTKATHLLITRLQDRQD